MCKLWNELFGMSMRYMSYVHMLCIIVTEKCVCQLPFNSSFWIDCLQFNVWTSESQYKIYILQKPFYRWNTMDFVLYWVLLWRVPLATSLLSSKSLNWEITHAVLEREFTELSANVGLAILDFVIDASWFMMCTKNLVCGYIFKLLSFCNIKSFTQDYKHDIQINTCTAYTFILSWPVSTLYWSHWFGNCSLSSLFLVIIWNFLIFVLIYEEPRENVLFGSYPPTLLGISCRVDRFPCPVNFKRPDSYFINFIRVITVLHYFTAFCKF